MARGLTTGFTYTPSSQQQQQLDQTQTPEQQASAVTGWLGSIPGGRVSDTTQDILTQGFQQSAPQPAPAQQPVDPNDPYYWNLQNILGAGGNQTIQPINLPGINLPQFGVQNLPQVTVPQFGLQNLPQFGVSQLPQVTVPGITPFQAVDVSGYGTDERAAIQAAQQRLLAGRDPLQYATDTGQFQREQGAVSDTGIQTGQLWKDILAQLEGTGAGLGQAEQQAIRASEASQAQEARRAAGINAAMGGGVGGGFAGGQAQAQLAGQAQRDQIRAQFAVAKDQQQLQQAQVKMARLQQLEQQAEAAQNRDLQRELQGQQMTLQAELARHQEQLARDMGYLQSTQDVFGQVFGAQTQAGLQQQQLSAQAAMQQQQLQTQTQQNLQNLAAQMGMQTQQLAAQMGMQEQELNVRAQEQLQTLAAQMGMEAQQLAAQIGMAEWQAILQDVAQQRDIERAYGTQARDIAAQMRAQERATQWQRDLANLTYSDIPNI